MSGIRDIAHASKDINEQKVLDAANGFVDLGLKDALAAGLTGVPGNAKTQGAKQKDTRASKDLNGDIIGVVAEMPCYITI